jgi:hypothetical protein
MKKRRPRTQRGGRQVGAGGRGSRAPREVAECSVTLAVDWACTNHPSTHYLRAATRCRTKLVIQRRCPEARSVRSHGEIMHHSNARDAFIGGDKGSWVMWSLRHRPSQRQPRLAFRGLVVTLAWPFVHGRRIHHQISQMRYYESAWPHSQVILRTVQWPDCPRLCLS